VAACWRYRIRCTLKKHEGAAATGQLVLPRVDRIRYEEVAEDLRTDYTTARDDHAVPRWATAALAQLAPFFAGRRVVTISPALVTESVARRQSDQAANATVNRELAVLGRMLRLAYEQGKLGRLPVIRKLKESAPREGFFERAQYEAVRRRLGPDLHAAVAIAYRFGWRVQEILGLERRQLDLEAGTLRLDPGTPTGVPHARARPRPGRAARASPGGRAQDRADHPVLVSPSLRPTPGRPAPPGLPEGLGDGLRAGPGARAAAARLPPDRG
jgi:integrase